MTEASEDPLYSILRSKREVTRLQFLVEIAEHQPAIGQQEIAGKLGVTPQAVSEYIRELVVDVLIQIDLSDGKILACRGSRGIKR